MKLLTLPKVMMMKTRMVFKLKVFYFSPIHLIKNGPHTIDPLGNIHKSFGRRSKSI